jgi:hypothetical protein
LINITYRLEKIKGLQEEMNKGGICSGKALCGMSPGVIIKSHSIKSHPIPSYSTRYPNCSEQLYSVTVLCYINCRGVDAMERELISKKDLLESTGISYGQLYRWKRKQLIPEDWFIRKATFTGQETFFPKDLILSRIEKIIHMKDDISLDELAGKLSPFLYDLSLSRDEMMKRNIVSISVMDRFGITESGDGSYSFEQILYLFLVEKLLLTGEMSLEEGAVLIETLNNHYSKFEGRPCEILFIRKMGVSMFTLLSVPSEIYMELGVKVLVRLSIGACIEELKLKLI